MNTNQRTTITLEAVTQAAEALISKGEKPTLSKIRDELGGGSFSTISPFFQTWSRNRRVVELFDFNGPNPLEGIFLRFASEVWATAQKAAKEQTALNLESLNKKYQELTKTCHELEQDRDEAIRFADQVAAENDALKEALAIEQALVKELRLKHMDLG